MTLLDWPFIERLEGGIVLRGYVPTDSSGAPLGQSGVTIGSGVDLGHWSEAQLRRRRVPADTIDLVRPFFGLRGWKALEVARDLRLSHQQAETLTRCIQGDIVDAVRDRYDAAIKPLPYETKVEAMRLVSITSEMKVRQMVRYLDAVQRECLQNGLRITDPDPDLSKYQARYRTKEAA